DDSTDKLRERLIRDFEQAQSGIGAEQVVALGRMLDDRSISARRPGPCCRHLFFRSFSETARLYVDELATADLVRLESRFKDWESLGLLRHSDRELVELVQRELAARQTDTGG